MKNVKVKLLSNNATAPKREHSTDAGLDIFAADHYYLEPQQKMKIATDIAVDIPPGYVGILTSRSGVSANTELVVTDGKIDAGFHGHMMINIKNDSQQRKTEGFEICNVKGQPVAINEPAPDEEHIDVAYKIERGDKIAQLLIIPIVTPDVEVVGEFDTETERGANGFGSTGY